MKNPFLSHGEESLAEAVLLLTWLLAIELSKPSSSVSRQDLDDMETRINMKLSAIQAQLEAVTARANEAYTEITARLDELVAQAQDPEVTDAAFLANLTSLQTKVDQLADIVPAVVVPPPVEPTA